MLPARWRARPWLRTLLSLWTWFEIGLICFWGCLSHLIFCALIWPVDRNRRLAGRFYRRIAVWAMRLSPMFELRQAGPVPTQIRGRTVVVCNHVSHLDSFVLATLPWEMKWLAKRSLLKIPLVGWNMRLTGDIPVVRGVKASIAQAMQRCAHYLRRDMPVCIFPEGTRSLTTELLPFKDGAFRLAIENGADILPLAVAGTQRGLPKHTWRFGFTRAVLKVGAPISTAGMGPADVAALRDRVRAQIGAMVAQIEPLARLDA